MDLTDLMSLARVVEDTLGSGGLARIDVGHDTEVTRMLKGGFSSHYA